jgi:serine/threonine protein phosphatase PrpC
MTSDYDAETGVSGDTTLSDEEPSQTRLLACSRSEPGLVRGLNEDCVFCSYETSRGVFAVADGMGGHQHGEIASAEAVRILGETLRPETLDGDGGDDMNALFDAIDGSIQEKATGGGTTLVAATVVDGLLTVAHLGDSRGYLVRDGKLHRLTTDDSLVESLVTAGRITPAESRVHPRRNVLLKALGPGRGDSPHILSMRFWVGDVLMLCSDGLHGVVDDDAIAREIAAAASVEEACDRLVKAAYAGGAPDNVSVVMATSVPA